MKKMFLIVAAISAIVSFSACSDDNDSDASIVGTWMITHSEGWVIYSDGSRDDFNDDYPNDIDFYYWTYSFDDKGACVRKSYTDHATDDDHPTYFTYTISGKTLTLKGKTDSELTVTGTIKELTSNKLVLYSSGEDDGEKFEYTYTYKKI